jgi:hypothetical protein
MMRKRFRLSVSVAAMVVASGGMLAVSASALPQKAPHMSAVPSPARPQNPPPKSPQPQPPQPHQHPPQQQPRPSSTSVLGKPPIEFHPETLDFGTIAPGARASANVYVHNVSDKILNVQYAKPDCSCTAANLSSNAIAPGQAVTLEVQYHANAIMGPWKGEVRVGIDGYDMVVLPAKAVVALAVRAEPPYVSAVPDLETRVRPLSGEYDVFSTDQKPFRILAVNGEAPSYVDFDPQADQPRHTYRLKWDFTSINLRTCRDKYGKRIPGWIVIETDHPRCPIFDLEVRHECNMRAVPKRTDTWRILEKRALLGAMKAGETSEFEVVAKWVLQQPGRDPIKTVVSETTQLTAELAGVEELADGFVCKVRVTPAQSHKGLVYGVVRLHSNTQNMPITVIGVVR